MENAGTAVAQFLGQRFVSLAQRRIVVLCGRGNNGGDGLVVARHLRTMGAQPVAVLFGEPADLRGDAALNCRRWQESPGELHVVRRAEEWQPVKATLRQAEIIVDALLGTGIRGMVEGILREAIEEVNRKRIEQQVIAVDIPSGFPTDGGERPGLGRSSQLHRYLHRPEDRNARGRGPPVHRAAGRARNRLAARAGRRSGERNRALE